MLPSGSEIFRNLVFIYIDRADQLDIAHVFITNKKKTKSGSIHIQMFTSL